MTAQQIYEMASSFLYEADGDDAESKDFSIGFLNVLLQEALETENSIRRFKETTELTEAPYLTALTDTINYDGAITRGALPYGLAAFYFQRRQWTRTANGNTARCIKTRCQRQGKRHPQPLQTSIISHMMALRRRKIK